MKKEYDFSKAEHGRFHRPGVWLNLPVYLEPKVRAWVSHAAKKNGENMGKLVNRLLKKGNKAGRSDAVMRLNKTPSFPRSISILFILSKSLLSHNFFPPPLIFGLKSQICNLWQVLQTSGTVLNYGQFFEMKNGNEGVEFARDREKRGARAKVLFVL